MINLKLKARAAVKAFLGLRSHFGEGGGDARQNLKSGFTLLELIVVISILSILSVGMISVVNPVEQIQKGNDGRRKSDLSQIQKALELYYEDNGRYPTSSPDYKILDPNNNIISWGNPWIPYMNLLPKDPSSAKTYVYVSDPSGQYYFLYASLDRGSKDSQVCNGGNACLNVPVGAESACGDICNFGASSPNKSP